ncbi:hypothetical protein ACFYO1_02835 [Nocardia sp. NPDC006044]|uniref:hypothetical protein n=1 Tax=Nocardia sp. NPDC006044 TaxID=3364306 RepID=UPI00367D611E
MTGAGFFGPPPVLPAWKARLLDRIEGLGARSTVILNEERPVYRPGDGRGGWAIEQWCSRLRDIDALRAELIERARTVGVDNEFITLAKDTGEQGNRGWHSRMVHPIVVHADDAARAPLLDAVAEDMWTLAQMAAVEAERLERHNTGKPFTVPDPESEQQYQRNMVALVQRVTINAAAVKLTDAERAEMAPDSVNDCVDVYSRTVHGRSDAELAQRWHTHAWPGVEWEAKHAVAHPTMQADVWYVHSPDELIERAVFAQQTYSARLAQKFSGPPWLDELTSPWTSPAEGLDTQSWGSEPAGEPLPPLPDPGSEAGPEW